MSSLRRLALCAARSRLANIQRTPPPPPLNVQGKTADNFRVFQYSNIPIFQYSLFCSPWSLVAREEAFTISQYSNIPIFQSSNIPIFQYSLFCSPGPWSREESSTNPQYSNIRSVQYILYCNVMYTQCTLCPISEFSRFRFLLPFAREESSTNPEYSNIPRLDLKGYPISTERRRTNGGGCSAFLGGARHSRGASDAP